MKKLLVTFIMAIGIITGCSSEDKAGQKETESPSLDIIEVRIEAPETVNLNEEVLLQAHVTQGTDKVDDAQEVKFEISQAGIDKNEMLMAENNGNGTYSVKKTFEVNGVYTVTAHVTARSMHSMPSKNITVGDGVTPANPTESGEEASTSHETDHHSDSSHQEHSHHDSHLEMTFNEETSFSINQEVLLETRLKLDEIALEGAKVRYEIIPDNGDKSDWIDAAETDKGIYTAPFTFTKADTYHVQIHVNKDELHEHKIFMFSVK
jgi:hypothetical protein